MNFREIITKQVGVVYFGDLAKKQYTKEQVIKVIQDKIEASILDVGPFSISNDSYLTFSFEDESGDGDSGPNYQLHINLNRPEDDQEYEKRLAKEREILRKKKIAEESEIAIYTQLREKYGDKV
jgi:hypothetical protein